MFDVYLKLGDPFEGHPFTGVPNRSRTALAEPGARRAGMCALGTNLQAPICRTSGRQRLVAIAIAEAKKVLVSDSAAILAGAVDPQNPHIARGRAAAGVGIDLVEHPIAAGAGHLSYAGIRACRPLARMLPEPSNFGSDCGQLASRGRPRARLAQPAADGCKIG